MAMQLPSIQDSLPSHKDLFYDGQWHAPSNKQDRETYSPGTGKVIDRIADAGVEDVDRAVQAARRAFESWRSTPAQQRAACMRRAADLMRKHAKELALLDALNTGNPVAEMLNDANMAAASLDYFAGLTPMLRGETIPQSTSGFHYTIREPLGVVARIIAFNHPVLFAGGKMAAPLAAGNTVIIKPPDQAPISCLRLAEILSDVFPPGVLSILPGSAECGRALSTHPMVSKVTLIGSVATGKAIQRAAADTLKPTLFELGGKNALLAFPDADIDKLVDGVARGMNFTWAGQSCGSTSRVFLHESHHDEVLDRVCQFVKTNYAPGVPTDMSTTMGPVISKAAQDRVLSYIASAVDEGATLVLGGKVPAASPVTDGGYFVEPTIFANVRPDMRIAREEIFGPVMAVFKWRDEDELIRQVNDTPYGLTAAIYTRSLATAHRTAARVEAGFVWVNQVGRHFLGVPFGGVKESGGGREECLDELLSFTQIKSVNLSLS
ncbi:betaine-aldehyde dehydrogenase [Coniochaeta ligniaria NRRL 30616]|uniref:aldehyde dehydrogenase (NAD(+)) n=1 Tax=Coniochaeta ligniaria NRRL 30616 TaxID=1408157 RepID=A0A1J7JHI1_9PEZI|nr:betaine-aldehyde dehydrogenase [Coniochaeta ligniaria NRRL 30616]